jgi:hypothetical protein
VNFNIYFRCFQLFIIFIYLLIFLILVYEWINFILRKLFFFTSVRKYVIMLSHIGHKKIIIEEFSGLVVLDIEF